MSVRERTPYRDVNGKRVLTGDKIDFAMIQDDGSFIHKIGHIKRLKTGEYVFYHNGNYKRLSRIDFDSTLDWRLIK